MAVFDQLTIPDEGVALLTSVIANQGTLTVTEMRFSDIDYTGQEHSITAATWAGTFQTVTPSASVHDTTTINVTGSFTNAGYSSDKTLKTVGIVGEDSNGVPTLIGVAVATSYDVIPQQYITPSTFTYSANIVVSSTADIHVSGSQAGALFVADVIDDLTSQDTDKPLSANQGYVLKGLIDNIHGGGSNPNLLDNPFFTVNQRGATSGNATSEVWTVDRWAANRINYSFTSSGCTLYWNGQSTGGYLQERLPYDSDWIGKEFTFSAIIDGNLYPTTFTMQATETTYSLMSGISAIIGADGTTKIVISLWTDSATSHTIKCAKLELGSTSTLALDELPPDYTTELLKCQRYYQVNKYFPCMFASTSKLVCVGQLQVRMRAIPDVTIQSNTAAIVDLGASSTLNITGFTKEDATYGSFRVSMAGTFTTGKAYAINLPVYFNAEL